MVLLDQHPLAARAKLTCRIWPRNLSSSARPRREIHDHLEGKLAALGRHPEIQVQSVSRDNLLPLVAIGRGLTLVSAAMTVATLPGITYRPITDEILPFSAVWSPINDNPAFRRLLSMARAVSAKPEEIMQSAP